MTYSIDDLKGEFGTGLAKTSLWRVFLPSVGGAFGITTRRLNVLCKNAQLPGRQILTNERIVGMKQHKLAYAYATDDVSLTFHVPNDYDIKQYFEFWQSKIINFNTKELNYPDEYGFEVRVQQLSMPKNVVGQAERILSSGVLSNSAEFDSLQKRLEDSKVEYTCILEKAFPTTMNAIEFSNEPGGMVELNVQLSYKDWRSV